MFYFGLLGKYGNDQPRPQSSLASFDVTSAVKLVGITHRGRLTINDKFKMTEQGQVSKLQPKKTATTFRF